MKRLVVVALVLLGACRHGTPEKLSIKAARTSRFADPWGSEPKATQAPQAP